MSYSDCDYYEDDEIGGQNEELNSKYGSWLEERIASGTKRAPKPSKQINPDMHSKIQHLKPTYHWPGENLLSIDLSAPTVLKWMPAPIIELDVIPPPGLRIGDKIEVTGYAGDAILRSLHDKYFEVSMMVQRSRYSWGGGTSLQRTVFRLNFEDHMISWRKSRSYNPKTRNQARKGLTGGNGGSSYSYSSPYRYNYGGNDDDGSGTSNWYPQSEDKKKKDVPTKRVTYSYAPEVKENRYRFQPGYQEAQERTYLGFLTEYLNSKRYNLTLRKLLSLPDYGQSTASPMKAEICDGFLVIDLNSKFPETGMASPEFIRQYGKKYKPGKGRRKRGTTGGGQEGEEEQQEEEEVIYEAPAPIEIESLAEKIEIEPTQSISDLLKVFGGSSVLPEDIFHFDPRAHKQKKKKKKPVVQHTHEEEWVGSEHPEPLPPEILYPVINTDGAKTNIFFEEFEEPPADNFYFTNPGTAPESLFFQPQHVDSEAADKIFWAQGAGEEPRGFVFVEI